MIRLTQTEWEAILKKLKEEYRSEPSMFLIRSKMRDVLGFTTRAHSQWVSDGTTKSGKPYGHYQDWIMLDFYNDAKETFFRLKYL